MVDCALPCPDSHYWSHFAYQESRILPRNDSGANPDSLFVDGSLSLQWDVSGSHGKSAYVVRPASHREDIASAEIQAAQHPQRSGSGSPMSQESFKY